MTDPVVLIPWQDTNCEHRNKAMFETMRHWSYDHGYIVRVCRLSRRETWCKALALADAWTPPVGDVVIVADADCLVDVQTVGHCVRIVADGAPWAIPHWSVRRLTPAATDRCIGWTADAEPLEEPESRPGCGGGGVVILRTDVALSVPMDSHYTEWGGEDYSWGLALDRLAGEPYRPPTQTPLVHLYHPRHPRHLTGKNLSSDEERRTAYFDAWRSRDSDAMRALVEGGRVWPHTSNA